jgi:hypothetical protein
MGRAAGIKQDHTLGYHDGVGFRCGSCYPFSVFSLSQRRELRLTETPLCLMDTSFVIYRHSYPDEMLKKSKSMMQHVARFGGLFTVLWHNSSINGPDYYKKAHFYEKLLSYQPTMELG